MTANDPSRLDRIEALLERSIIDSDQRHREVEQRQLETERQQQASNERLGRIEDLIAQTMQITQSNARSIEAMGTQFDETKKLADRVFQRMDSLTQQLAASMSNRNDERNFLVSIKAGIDKLLRRSEQ